VPRGAAVIEYRGKRGVVFRIKYVDADGQQVMETVGRAADGWTERKAERELGHRLHQVEQGRRKPVKLTFGGFSDRFLDEHLPGRNLKRSTAIDYTHTIRQHLVPVIGDHPLGELERRPELIEGYIATKISEGLSAKTIRNHLTLLGRMFKVAMRWNLAQRNPVALVDPPRALEEPDTEVLTEPEIARLLTAYRQLELDPPEDTEAVWWATTRRVVTVALGTGLRRGELLGLRWQDVALLDGRLSVRQAWVRNEMTSPKSKASRRTLGIGARTLEALQEQWQASRYRTDDDVVFCHPALGTPLDPSKLSSGYMRPALAKAAITKRFRTWHGLRHTALTHEAAVNPQAYVQMRAGHAQGSITERYIHAAQVAFPGAVEAGESRIFSSVGVEKGVETAALGDTPETEKSPLAGSSQLPGLDSNQQPSG